MRGTLFQIARDLSSKQQKAKAVFKPSHILPTITVEEAGLLELEEVCSSGIFQWQQRDRCSVWARKGLVTPI